MAVNPAARILIIDDDAVFRAEFAVCCAEYGVVQAASGQEALALLQQPHALTLAFLDVRLPDLNGIDLIPRLRALAPGLRIVILTGYSSTATAIAALRGQADDYLEKPLDPECALQVIKRHLDAQAPPGADRLTRVREFIRQNAHRDVALTDAARVACVTPKHLSRLLRGAGEGFAAFRTRVRIELARELLANSSRSVGDIAFAVGYHNPASFIRKFRRLTGTTPAVYRAARRLAES